MTKKQKEQINSAVQEMKKLQVTDDPEKAHGEADQLLCDVLEMLGCSELVEEYKKVPKWYA